MSQVLVNDSQLGGALKSLLSAADIEPGSEPSYHLCKTIYEYHVLGARLVEAPLRMAQSQARDIKIARGPEERLRKAFVEESEALGVDKYVFSVGAFARVYGAATVAMVTPDLAEAGQPIDYTTLAGKQIRFNVWDPLNTAGSLVLNQDPNAFDFQRPGAVQVSGTQYHLSRAVTLLNGSPVYIGWTASSFGYVGRSVYQRVLFPLKSFINTLVTDDMVARKAGLIVAKMKTAGSIVDNLMARIAGLKRNILKEGETNNVLSIDITEEIETLDMKNLDAPYALVRKNILENIAAGDDMPAILLNSETFAEGFGEGTEDAKKVATYVDGKRKWLAPAYAYFDKIVMHRAWSEEFYATIQADFPESYADVKYEQAFYEWANSFVATWPSLLTEPDSEKVKVDEVKLKSVIAAVQVLAPMVDPENTVELVKWLEDNFNQLELILPSPMQLDFDALLTFLEEREQQAKDAADAATEAKEGGPEEPAAPKPFSAADADPAPLSEDERRRARRLSERRKLTVAV